MSVKTNTIIDMGLVIGGLLIKVIQDKRNLDKVAVKAAELVLEKQAG